jgi:pectin methylesterase-like acyl-CoA thioesterase
MNRTATAWACFSFASLAFACSGDKANSDVGADGSAAFGAGPNAGGQSGASTNGGGSSTGGGNSGLGGSISVGGASGATAGGSAGATASGGGSGNPNTGGNSAFGGTSGGGGVSGEGGAGTTSGGTSASGGNGGNSNTGGRPNEMGLPPGVTYLFPPPNGTGVCPDPPLRLSFSGAPTLGNSGRIQVYDGSGNAVASVDMAQATITDTREGTTFNVPRQAYVDGNDAVIYLKTKALTYGQTYYVTVDAGAITPPGGGSFSISGSSSWRFSTTAAPPNALSALTVALDGSGNFCSVQGAADALPSNNQNASTITIAPGLYHEIVHMSGKSNVTFHGQDREQTVILGTNNNNLNPSTSTRSLVGFDGTNGLVAENLTIHNLTPQDGSQAEALRLQNCDKCAVRNADILSLQDTLLWSGRVYASNCYIAGNVDYVWGTGVAYFDKCEIHTVGRTGVLVQSRNAPGAYGYVFVDSKLTADANAPNNMLARIDVSAYPGSQVAYINCQMTNISSAGWTITGGAASSALRFSEYQSVDASGNPINTSGRVSGSTQLSSSDAAAMRNTATVLNGWQPSP